MQQTKDREKRKDTREFNWQVSIPDSAREFRDPLTFGWWLLEGAIRNAQVKNGVQIIRNERDDRQIDFHIRVWGIDFEGTIKIIAMPTGCVLLFMGNRSSAGFVLSYNIGVQIRQAGLNKFQKQREQFLELIEGTG